MIDSKYCVFHTYLFSYNASVENFGVLTVSVISRPYEKIMLRNYPINIGPIKDQMITQAQSAAAPIQQDFRTSFILLDLAIPI